MGGGGIGENGGRQLRAGEQSSEAGFLQLPPIKLLGVSDLSSLPPMKRNPTLHALKHGGKRILRPPGNYSPAGPKVSSQQRKVSPLERRAWEPLWAPRHLKPELRVAKVRGHASVLET